MSCYDELEVDYGVNIIVNDRHYDIYDKGEGECEIILVDQPQSITHEDFNNFKSKRVIVIDVTFAWNSKISELSSCNLYELAKDIHLIADIYWIDSLTIGLSKNDMLYQILKSKLRSRLKMN